MEKSLFFEGPEKKLEIVFNQETPNLLQKDPSFWENLVSNANAKILSELKTPDCLAYLLSESSLFIWNNRVVLITCGTTTLIKAFDFLVNAFSKNAIQDIFYERKNEYQPTLQKSTAIDDIQTIKKSVGGVAFRFGRLDDHHVFVHNSNLLKQTESSKIETTEVLMYGLKGEFKNLCVKDTFKQNEVINNLKAILPGYEFDSFFFEPEGFSFNAIKGSYYATMHVTPQGLENYLSFEMDGFTLAEGKKNIESLLNLCKPLSFDVVHFSEFSDVELPVFPGCAIKQKSTAKLESDYYVHYTHYFDSQNTFIEPVQL